MSFASLLVGGQILDAVGERPHLVANRLGLRAGARPTSSRTTPRRVRSVSSSAAPVGVEQLEQRRGAAHEEVGVVLPRDGDAAVHLGVQVGAQIGGRCRQRGGDRRRVASAGRRRSPTHGRASHTALVASSVATTMLAQWCLTAWYMAIGRPNWMRSLE